MRSFFSLFFIIDAMTFIVEYSQIILISFCWLLRREIIKVWFISPFRQIILFFKRSFKVGLILTIRIFFDFFFLNCEHIFAILLQEKRVIFDLLIWSSLLYLARFFNMIGILRIFFSIASVYFIICKSSRSHKRRWNTKHSGFCLLLSNFCWFDFRLILIFFYKLIYPFVPLTLFLFYFKRYVCFFEGIF